MKKSTLAGLAGAMLLTLPMAATADTGAEAHLFINGSGIHAIRAEVTAVSGSVISAISHFGSNVMNWSIATSADTKFVGAATSTASIKVGDKINVSGTLTGIGSTFSVTAKKVREVSEKTARKLLTGTVASINAAAGSFTLSARNSTYTVQTNGSTTFKLNGATSTFGTLFVGEKVGLWGTTNASTSLITATQVSGRTVPSDDKKDDDHKGKDHKHLLKGFLRKHFDKDN